MKLIHCNGQDLRVWDISDKPVFRLTAGLTPIKMNGYHILNEDEAHALVKEAMLAGAVKQEAER